MLSVHQVSFNPSFHPDVSDSFDNVVILGHYCEGDGEPPQQCSGGYVCSNGAIVPDPEDGTTGYPCPVGHFCPPGAVLPKPCPAGLYADDIGLEQCTEKCEEGFFCPTGSNSSDVFPCLEGFHCPEESKVGNPPANICQLGASCPTGSAESEPCEAGTFSAIVGAGQCSECVAGFYCTGGNPGASNDVDKVNLVDCSAGSHCDTGSIEPSECPRGTFSGTKTPSENNCSPCPAGHLCGGGTRDEQVANGETLCSERYFCPESTDRGVACEVGYQCPLGSPQPQPCNEGSISKQSYVSECAICPAGTYCPRVTTSGAPYGETTEELDCDIGTYCTANSSYPVACPAGSFISFTGAKAITDCEQCPEGEYCQSSVDDASKPCHDGYYCISGSATPRPGCAEKHEGSGEICPLGQICIGGRSEPCPAGKICQAYGEDSVDDLSDCPEGFYCTPGTVHETVAEIEAESIPISCGLNSDGTQKTVGVFCPEGSSSEQRCPEGTWSMSTGNRVGDEGNCTACPEGMACMREGIYNVTESGTPAAPGYFIAAKGSVTNKPDSDEDGSKCSKEHHCPVGSKNEVVCDPGTHQPSVGRSTCNSCSTGKFCPGGISSDNTVPRQQQNCEEGHYCPSASYRPIPCPAGTYGNDGVTSYKSLSNCRTCRAGRYCSEEASLQSVIDGQLCEAGFFCSQGSNSSRPNEVPFFNVDSKRWEGNAKCPIGYYCPEGSSQPVPCPMGTYGIESAAVAPAYSVGNGLDTFDVKGCFPCPPGFYCDQLNMTLVDSAKSCPEGSYCPQGASRGDQPCSKGYYCPAKTPIEVPCPPGTYQNEIGKASCKPCPAGKYCDGFDAKPEAKNCEVGHYCPEGTDNPIACKPGTFNPDRSSTDSTACIPCSQGYFCPNFGMSILDETFVCQKGYHCHSGSVHPRPYNDTSNEPCPPGFFCPNEYNINPYLSILTPQACPRGTYNPSTTGESEDDCLPCRGGWVCETSGLFEPTRKCPAGFFCPSDEKTYSPTNVCPINYYCPEGTADPIPCPLGYYQLQTQSEECIICPPGSYCPRESTNTEPIRPIKCNSKEGGADRAVYCDEGSEYEKPCPPGTYTSSSSKIGLVSASECKPCPFGQFCQEGKIQGACAGGFLCFSGADAPNPTYGKLDGNETVIIRPFVENQMIRYDINQNLTSDGACPVGVICAGPCPPGFYCFENRLSKKSDIGACPGGTYRGEFGADSPEDCDTCPAGHQCKEGDAVLYDCPKGHYCPVWYPDKDDAERKTVFWQGVTVEGKDRFYLNPSPEPIPCPLYTYNDQGAAKNVDECLYCPPGYFCNEEGVATLDGKRCPPGYYCAGQGTPPALCPAGTMAPGGDEPFKSLLDCLPCEAGRYCPVPSELSPNIDGVVCPVGFECPEGNRVPFLCRAGRFCPEEGLAEGLPCEAGFFCPESTVNIFVNGSTNASDPIQKLSEYYCDFPYYCPEESASPLYCQLGYEPIESDDLRTNPFDFCSICSAGSFRATFNETSCLPCLEGFYCPEGTSNLGDNICTEGHECPLGGKPSFFDYDQDCTVDPESNSSVCCKTENRELCYDPNMPIPCIPGTYSFGPGNKQCLDCPVNTLNRFSEMTQCNNCGSTSRSDSGSTECTCEGENRVHQPSDGSCVCKFGFTSDAFYADSTESCVEKFIEDCDQYSAIDQTCFAGECPAGQTFDPNFQLCTSSEQVVPSDDYIVQEFEYDLETQTLTDKLTGDAEFTDDILNFESTLQKIALLQENSGNLDFESQILSVTDQNFITSRITKNNRFRRQSLTDESITGWFISFVDYNFYRAKDQPVKDPILCVTPSTLLIFELTSDLGYPIFARDSSLNTNPDFDLGEFRSLQYFMDRTDARIDRFSFAFGDQPTDQETYVFTHSNNQDSYFIITVRLSCNNRFR